MLQLHLFRQIRRTVPVRHASFIASPEPTHPLLGPNEKSRKNEMGVWGAFTSNVVNCRQSKFKGPGNVAPLSGRAFFFRGPQIPAL